MTLGHFCMAFDQSFLLALLLLIVGAGFLRGNLIAQVGGLYQEGDERSTRAMQIYYAMIGYRKRHEGRVRQEDAVADLQGSIRLSNMRYAGGTTTYLEVLDGQRALFAAELTLAQARGDEYQSLVQLYKSLGGGWEQ